MAWRDEYQPGSFRGAAFRTEFHELSGGRRNALHEFPGRDEPVVEDLGRRARQFSIDCHVVGLDYTGPRDALLDALEASGPGMLIHPWHGRMMVSVLDFSQSESTDEGGITRFRITFTEAGEAASAPVSVAAGNASAIEADRVVAAAPGLFAADFSIDGAAGFVEDNAAALVDGIGAISLIAAGLRGGAGPTLRAFEAGLRFLPDNISGLLRAPLQLGLAITGLVQSVAVLGGGSRNSRIAALEVMLDWQPDLVVFPLRTPQRLREAGNRTAMLHLFCSVVAAELVRVAGSADYASYDDASAVRDRIADRLDVLALDAGDRGDDKASRTFDRLRHALARDIAVRGANLARVYSTQLTASEPALVLAHRLYGNAGRLFAGESAVTGEQSAAGIVARNNIVHPGFVPAGVSLELLTVEGASA